MQQPNECESEDQYWDDVLCPICMEHPHNAVLLHCRSTGCRPVMCDDRLASCFDGFLNSAFSLPVMTCPLCRGTIAGWSRVAQAPRRRLNAKTRSCSVHSCNFTGSYRELRRHARTEHPPASNDLTLPYHPTERRRYLQGDDFATQMQQPLLLVLHPVARILPLASAAGVRFHSHLHGASTVDSLHRVPGLFHSHLHGASTVDSFHSHLHRVPGLFPVSTSTVVDETWIWEL